MKGTTVELSEIYIYNRYLIPQYFFAGYLQYFVSMPLSFALQPSVQWPRECV